jgi:hypothetical protein
MNSVFHEKQLETFETSQANCCESSELRIPNIRYIKQKLWEIIDGKPRLDFSALHSAYQKQEGEIS